MASAVVGTDFAACRAYSNHHHAGSIKLQRLWHSLRKLRHVRMRPRAHENCVTQQCAMTQNSHQEINARHYPADSLKAGSQGQISEAYRLEAKKRRVA